MIQAERAEGVLYSKKGPSGMAAVPYEQDRPVSEPCSPGFAWTSGPSRGQMKALCASPAPASLKGVSSLNNHSKFFNRNRRFVLTTEEIKVIIFSNLIN